MIPCLFGLLFNTHSCSIFEGRIHYFDDKILFVEPCSISLVDVSYGGIKISWRSLKCPRAEIKSFLTTTTKISSTHMFAKVAQEYCLYHPNISIAGKVVLSFVLFILSPIEN